MADNNIQIINDNDEIRIDDYIDLEAVKFKPVKQSHKLTLRSQLVNVPKTLEYLEAHYRDYCQTHEIDPYNIRYCLHEALTNSIVHGNFGISSTLKDSNWDEFYSIVQSRESDPAYAEKKVYVLYFITEDQLRFEIEDEGQGCDFKIMPKPETNAKKEIWTFGRGIQLIRRLSHGVFWNKAGNRISIMFRPQKKPVKVPRQNCWEFFNCGRELGGHSVAEHGECPASALYHADGFNHGTNGGRVCWAINGTICKSAHPECTEGCHKCAFYKKVNEEESGRFYRGDQLYHLTRKNKKSQD
ncbi:MAG: ATP-binding protein [SAR324 cluster bacterium]|nr:ATP-binding protein [SAR324 cluster bacterium]